MKHHHHTVLADFRITPRTLFISLLALVVGAGGACIAAVLTRMIGFFTNLFFFHRISFSFVSDYPNHLGWTVVLVPALGGLIIGLMARFGSDKIRGHGIPEAMEAILNGKSLISPKVAILKPISAAVSIGSGGPFGAEGPIIMTGGAVGSVIGQCLALSAAERKILLLCGAAAGMCATFNAPVASVLFAVELLAFEMRPRSIMPIALASAVANVVRDMLIGGAVMFPSSAKLPMDSHGLLVALLFGLAGPGLAYILTKLIYAAEDGFAKLPIHWMYWPVLGGLVIGLGGLFVPRVLGVGYDSIAQLVQGQFPLSLAISFLIVKSVVWIVALGSGTSGGILAPVLLIGGSLGDVLAAVFHASDTSAWCVLGMAAAFAGVTRSPFTAIAFTLELTHDMSLLGPLMASCALATGLSAMILPRSILTEKIARRNRLISRDLAIDPLELHTVGVALQGKQPLLAEHESAAQALERLEEGGPFAILGAFAVTDDEGRAKGVVTMRQLREHADRPHAEESLLHRLARPVPTIHVRQTAAEALSWLLTHGTDHVVVVEDGFRPVGVVTPASLLAMRQAAEHEETERKRHLFTVRRRVPKGGKQAVARL